MIWTTFARRTLANVCLLVAFHSLAAPGRCQDNLAWKSTTMNGVKLEFTATQLGPFDDPRIRVQWKMSYLVAGSIDVVTIDNGIKKKE